MIYTLLRGFGLGVLLCIFLATVSLAQWQTDHPPTAISDTLRLDEALGWVLARNPQLQAVKFRVEAAAGTAVQAGLRPNPELSVSLEDFGGASPFAGLGQAESFLGLNQSIELGGDRQKHRQVGRYAHELTIWDQKSLTLDLTTQAKKAFFRVLAEQEHVQTSQNLRDLAAQFEQTVQNRAEAGKVSALESNRAGVVRATAEIDLQRATHALIAARKQLAALWGESVPDFAFAEGSFTEVQPLPTWEMLEAQIVQNPDVARWATEVALRQAGVALEKAHRMPNPELSLGSVFFRESGTWAFRAGLSLALPVFDRNQGRLQATKARVQEGRHLQINAQVQVQQALARAYEKWGAVANEAQQLQGEIIPLAQETFEAVQIGYREGKFDLLTVLDVQRTLFETRSRLVEALAQYHFYRAEVERLIGAPFASFENQ